MRILLPHRTRVCSFAVLLAYLMVAEQGWGQDRPTEPSPLLRLRVTQPKAHCFRGRPLPVCDGFWITEFGAAKRLDAKTGPSEGSALFTWELGYMTNRNPRAALGASVVLAASGETGGRLGLRGRYRRWLAETSSFDASAGLFLIGNSQRGEYAYPRFTGSVALNLGDWIAFTTEVEHQRYGRRRGDNLNPKLPNDLAGHVGVKLGSYPGAIVGTAGPLIAVAALMAAFSGWGGSGGSTGGWDYTYMAIRGRGL